MKNSDTYRIVIIGCGCCYFPPSFPTVKRSLCHKMASFFLAPNRPPFEGKGKFVLTSQTVIGEFCAANDDFKVSMLTFCKQEVLNVVHY